MYGSLILDLASVACDAFQQRVSMCRLLRSIHHHRIGNSQHLVETTTERQLTTHLFCEENIELPVAGDCYLSLIICSTTIKI